MDEGVWIPGLGVAREVPPRGQKAQGEDQEEGDTSHALDLFYILNLICFVMIGYIFNRPGVAGAVL